MATARALHPAWQPGKARVCEDQADALYWHCVDHPDPDGEPLVEVTTVHRRFRVTRKQHAEFAAAQEGR
jgi:hypothetical protein